MKLISIVCLWSFNGLGDIISFMKKHNNKSLPEGWTITTIQSFEEIEHIRPVWEKMQRAQPFAVPDGDIDRYLSVLSPIKNTTQPHIIILSYNGHPEAMMIGQIGTRRIECRIGYLTLFKPSLRWLSIVYGGILGRQDSETCTLLVEELIRTLKKGEADVVMFNHLPTDSNMYYVMRGRASVLSRNFFPKLDIHWRMSVPENMDVFYEKFSPKHRRNIKRCIRKLEREHRVQVKNYRHPDELDEAITFAAKISSRTYQHGLGCGFMDDASTRSRLTTAAHKGWLHMYILFIDDVPCAFQVGLQYEKTYFWEQTGYKPEWKQLSIGSTLFIKVLEGFCNHSQVASIDFGFGDAEYKQWYGNNHWPEATVSLFAPRFYPILVNALISLTRGISLGLSWFARSIGFERWAKRGWRNVLQKNRREEKQRR